jgi:hypothetical protein
LLWAQVATGTELTADGTMRVLDSTTWRERRDLFNSQKSNQTRE